MGRLQASNFGVLAFGGLAGALARWGVEEVLPQGVLIANTVGSAILGAAVADWLRISDLEPARSSGSDVVSNSQLLPRRLLLIDFLISFCGSFTTFSAVTFAAAEHLNDSSVDAGIWLLALSFGLGLPASWAGFVLWRRRTA